MPDQMGKRERIVLIVVEHSALLNLSGQVKKPDIRAFPLLQPEFPDTGRGGGSGIIRYQI